MTNFTIQETFPVSSKTIYQAFLNSEQHTLMTGGEAECSDKVSHPFTAWDGYISGKNVSLEPNKIIVQKWRTTEFSSNEADSDIKIELKELDGGCELTLTHTNIPDGQSDYKQGWVDHYFTPMKEYFNS